MRPGGAFGPGLVLVGEVALARGDAWAERARQELEAALRRATRQVRGFFVGEDAMQRLRAGAQLRRPSTGTRCRRRRLAGADDTGRVIAA